MFVFMLDDVCKQDVVFKYDVVFIFSIQMFDAVFMHSYSSEPCMMLYSDV
jgi:hypothetical protein